MATVQDMSTAVYEARTSGDDFTDRDFKVRVGFGVFLGFIDLGLE